MNKKIIILSIIILLIALAIIFISYSSNETDDNIDDDQIIKNDISFFIGKWDDLFYSLDDTSYSTWEFYENNSIKNSTTGIPYGGTEPLTIVKWHKFKLEDDLIYLKFNSEDNFQPYDYAFSTPNHLAIYKIDNVLGIPIISLNRIST